MSDQQNPGFDGDDVDIPEEHLARMKERFLEDPYFVFDNPLTRLPLSKQKIAIEGKEKHLNTLRARMLARFWKLTLKHNERCLKIAALQEGHHRQHPYVPYLSQHPLLFFGLAAFILGILFQSIVAKLADFLLIS